MAYILTANALHLGIACAQEAAKAESALLPPRLAPYFFYDLPRPIVMLLVDALNFIPLTRSMRAVATGAIE